MAKPTIVILGAGYGGLMAATRLQKKLDIRDAHLVLINKHPYHYESTWLHEGAAGTLHHDRMRYPIAEVLDSSKVQFIRETVSKVDQKEKKVILEHSSMSYDYLIFALGFESETFGIPGLKEHAFSIANINAVRRIREHIEYQFATYSHDFLPERLTFVVGGAGFTGIEFLGEFANRVPALCEEFDINPGLVKVICVEAAPSALPGFDPELVEYATEYLTTRGVEFKIGTAIKEAKEGSITVEKEGVQEEIHTNTVIWAAGVRGSSVIETSGFEAMRGRVKVDEYLRLPGSEDIFVIGDSSVVFDSETERPYPPTAQIAMQQGENVAKNLAKIVTGREELTPFTFENKGVVCSLGHHDAIGMVFGKKLTGSQASFMKKVVDNRALLLIGGPGVLLKKGKFNIF